MDESILRLLSIIQIPQMAEVGQIFPREKIENVEEDLNRRVLDSNVSHNIKPGMRIAVTAGSRGIANIAEITRWTIKYLKSKGAIPFIVPAMGSHGGATSEGQVRLLEAYGITAETMGAPVISSMEVVKIEHLKDGTPVYFDRTAFAADGVVLINRIKLHTGFRGQYESGLLKMLTVGLGKQAGADAYHSNGLGQLGRYISEAGELLLGRLNVIMGVAIIENAYEDTCKIEILKGNDILQNEPGLLSESKAQMPSIKFRNLDVLIIDEIGKNYSGAGLDPNITGKFINPDIPSNPIADKILVLGLSQETHGNGNGIGLADVTTKRVLDQMDYGAMYMNGLTSGVSASSKIPMYYDNDRDAIKAAIKLSNKVDPSTIRMVRIHNTLELQRIYISEALEKEADKRDDIVFGSAFKPLGFNQDGDLF